MKRHPVHFFLAHPVVPPKGCARAMGRETAHRLIDALPAGGESGAAARVAKLDRKADPARELAYRLYTVCERERRVAEALSCGGLVQSSPEIARPAVRPARAESLQGGLFRHQ
jgi:putative DNA methylase